MSHNCKCGKGENCCGNSQVGFPCSCDHEERNPGTTDYTCEYCGFYTASKPRCNKCEAEEPYAVSVD